MRKAILVLGTVFLSILYGYSQAPDPVDYVIPSDGIVSEELLRKYLRRNMGATELFKLAPYSDCWHQPDAVDTEEFNCWMNFIQDTKPK